MKINNGGMIGKKEINIFFSISFLFLQRNFFLCNNDFLMIKNRSALSDFVINYLQNCQDRERRETTKHEFGTNSVFKFSNFFEN